jgi:hypothetical protein
MWGHRGVPRGEVVECPSSGGCDNIGVDGRYFARTQTGHFTDASVTCVKI